MLPAAVFWALALMLDWLNALDPPM